MGPAGSAGAAGTAVGAVAAAAAANAAGGTAGISACGGSLAGTAMGTGNGLDPMPNGDALGTPCAICG